MIGHKCACNVNVRITSLYSYCCGLNSFRESFQMFNNTREVSESTSLSRRKQTTRVTHNTNMGRFETSEGQCNRKVQKKKRKKYIEQFIMGHGTELFCFFEWNVKFSFSNSLPLFQSNDVLVTLKREKWHRTSHTAWKPRGLDVCFTFMGCGGFKESTAVHVSAFLLPV